MPRVVVEIHASAITAGFGWATLISAIAAMIGIDGKERTLAIAARLAPIALMAACAAVCCV